MSTQQLAVDGREMSRRSKVLIAVGGGIVLLSMLVTAVSILLAGDQRVLVVTMAQDAVQADRVALKEACGSLPGIRLVEDKGDPSASVQGRFPVRFDLSQSTSMQEIALNQCINEHDEKVRGFLTEGDN